jgi:hypothetical protein
MIMKNPLNSASPALEGAHENNRNVGGRQSSKNFRKELKRYTMVDVAGGVPTLAEASSTQNPFLFVGPYSMPKRCDTATPKNLLRQHETTNAEAPAFSLQAQKDDG